MAAQLSVHQNGETQLMGGDVTVTSVPGESSTLTVKVPACVRPLELPKSEATVLVAPPLTSVAGILADTDVLLLIDCTIQVIDDEAIQRDLARRFLSNAGFTV